MKLYTEEQMRRCYAGVLQNVGTCIKQSDLPKEDEYINSLTPIELPSDEQIERYVESTPYYGHCTTEFKEGIEDGAEWVINQIKQQENGK